MAGFLELDADLAEAQASAGLGIGPPQSLSEHHSLGRELSVRFAAAYLLASFQALARVERVLEGRRLLFLRRTTSMGWGRLTSHNSRLIRLA